MNYYEQLGVSPQATEKEIKTAYRKLVKKYHPDVVRDDPVLTKKMYEIQAAYQIIGDEAKRKKYDKAQTMARSEAQKKQPAGQGQGQGGTGKPVPDMSQFEQFFGFRPGQGMETYHDSKQQTKKPEGPIKPEEMFAAFFGAKKR